MRQHGIAHFLDMAGSGCIDLTPMLTHTSALTGGETLSSCWPTRTVKGRQGRDRQPLGSPRLGAWQRSGRSSGFDRSAGRPPSSPCRCLV